MDSKNIIVDISDNSDQRIDKWLCEYDSSLSRSLVQRLITEGLVTVNGKKTAKSYNPRAGDRAEIILPPPQPLDATAENIPLEIVYEDDELLVVNKPKGMVVHPAPSHYSGTLVNALLYHCGERLSSINGVIRPGIVHRIDKDTSGLLIAAKTDDAHNGLAEQIREHTFTREYKAIVHGHLKKEHDIIEFPIGRHRTERKKMAVMLDGGETARTAKTEYWVCDEYNGKRGKHSLLRLKLYTGRTHQIRVHAAYIGHAVLGDAVYGKPSDICNGQCLHAEKIGFVHPKTGEYIEFTSDLPEYFLRAIKGVTVL